MKLAINNGLEIEQEPKNEYFAYHMKVKDLDGNILWLGTERKESEHDGGGHPAAGSELRLSLLVLTPNSIVHPRFLNYLVSCNASSSENY